ncbi:hypothetical protein GLOTRDRAFT_132911 [Gloeophyllum trabeum ATCC 11539]|uniref:Uncharacterized protein n=1 Tax=Gloeophyllum trabeum (strain ATCC 11539 / FP-39264 / Madison 617) TaxID=670483 RepID=S7RBE5_GLOTA|nr:uncharacterized protein GLOTRDRAFT_132911 [Gloeophyllum trabeum ATCC 11539]EPQ51545.1 hypothetical protein GLOTRDRAFT_132911 [Gloeophyllum trabeum ATCC 11539]
MPDNGRGRRKLLVQSRWNGRDKLYQPHPAGKGKICVGALNGPGDFVSSFVVDEKHRTVISCDRHGGITVTAIETDRVLWRLPGTNAAGYGDCQFSDGFLTFLSSNPRCIEVWRRSGDSQSTFSGDDAVKTPVLDPSAAPSHEQLDNSISASALAVYSEKPPSARDAEAPPYLILLLVIPAACGGIL